MKIGFIGAGNMASAILKGAVRGGAFTASDLYAYDVDAAKTEALNRACGVQAADSAEALLAEAQVVVLAVKPNILQSLLPTLRAKLEETGALVISIAAGKTIDFLQALLYPSAPIVRVMPNINATVGAAMSAYCCNMYVTDAQKQVVETLCSSFGACKALPEASFPLFSVLAGCAPAYFYMFIDALARAGVKNGMAKADALEIAAQTALGSAKQILESGVHPWELVDRVCSPGGTTIEGVAALQASALDAAVVRAVDAALEKDKRL